MMCVVDVNSLFESILQEKIKRYLIFNKNHISFWTNVFPTKLFVTFKYSN
jgi:hypothetical protein